jgi:hypothetical protein
MTEQFNTHVTSPHMILIIKSHIDKSLINKHNSTHLLSAPAADMTHTSTAFNHSSLLHIAVPHLL